MRGWMPSHGRRTPARICRARPARIPKPLPQLHMSPGTQHSSSLQPCTPYMHTTLQHTGVEDWTYHSHTLCTTCAAAEGARSAEDCEEWLLGDPKQPQHTQSAAQQAVHARAAVFQSCVCGGQWQMVKIHLASARACGNRSTCAAEGACCEWHGRCVSRRERLRGPVAVCGRHAVCSMLQQAGCRHRQ